MDGLKRPRSLHTATLLADVQHDLELLFTSISESILLIETNGTILVANDVSARWLNHKAEALVGENLFQLLTPFGIPIREWAYEAISKNNIFEQNTNFEEGFLYIRLIPVSEAGKIRRLIFIGQDITEHKQAEEQVREFTDQMERKVRERTKELEALNQKLIEDKRRSEIRTGLSQYLMRESRDYNRLLEHITTEISNLYGDTCLIGLFTSDLTQMEVRAIMNHDADSLQHQRNRLLNRFVSVETNAIASRILKGERFSARAISREKGAELLPAEFAAELGEDGLSVLEVFPLHTGDHPLGMLAMAREYGNPYSEDEISFIGSFLSSIALAIQNARLFEQLTESQNQLRGLSQQLVQIQEKQFSHLAEELHDRVGQDMTAININLNILRTLLPRDVPEGVITRLADMEKLVIESVKRVRSAMSELRPPMLDKYGLAAALYWYSEEYHRRTEIQVNINERYMKNSRLPSEIEIALFRIAQEALNNVVKHANATKIDIELFEEEGNTMMVITDNGLGFDTKVPNFRKLQHWGVPLMQERARAINGEFLLRSVPGQGTQIVVRVKKSS
jgi:PAS domain S-box-containing protein